MILNQTSCPLYTNGNIYVMNNEAYSDITKPPVYSETKAWDSRIFRFLI